jgi:DNA mismatch endonuclease (patch repair protein)
MSKNLTASGDRRHRGDIMSPETRSSVMSRIKGKDTGPELLMQEALAAGGYAFERHARDLPGRPDFVYRAARVAVFVDGDFWHGHRFAEWRMKLSEKWETKIATTMARDRRNRRALRAAGWSVITIWEHRVKADPARAARRVRSVVAKRLSAVNPQI